MGPRLGIVAGSGGFPLQAAEEARKRGISLAIALISGESHGDFVAPGEAFRTVDPGDLGGLTAFFLDQGITDILLAGKVDPAILLDPTSWDRAARTLIEDMGPETGPETALRTLIEHLGRQGLRVIDPTPFLEPYFCLPGVLTASVPSREVLRDMEFGWSRARVLSDLDIGQTIVVKSGLVVAVEGLEGTDRALERAGKLAGPGIVAVKVGRTRQDPRIDLPAVGGETIRVLAEARATALFFEAKTIPFFDRDDAVRVADRAGVAVVAR